MKYVSEDELRKWLITDGCVEGHGYIDEDDFVCMNWQDSPTKTGHWKLVYRECGIVFYLCGSCNEGRAIIDGNNYKSLDEFKICPNCGARMMKGRPNEF